MIESIKKRIINYVFNISRQPVLLHELLEANKLFNEGMHLDGKKLGFRLRMGRAYLVFVLLAHVVIIPAAGITHVFFMKADCHASIVVAILFTGLVFASFGLFKEWLSDEIAKKRIKTAWELHFPHFPYEEYQEEVSRIYDEALSKDIGKKDMQRFIVDKLVSTE